MLTTLIFQIKTRTTRHQVWLRAVLDYSGRFVKRAESAQSPANSSFTKRPPVLTLSYMTRFLLLVFCPFPQTRTFNSKQQQHQTTVKSKTRLCSVSFCFVFSFIIFILLFHHRLITWWKYFKYWSVKETIKSWRTNAIARQRFRSGNCLSGKLLLLHHRERQDAAVARGKAGLRSKPTFNMEITEKFPTLTFVKNWALVHTQPPFFPKPAHSLTQEN